MRRVLIIALLAFVRMSGNAQVNPNSTVSRLDAAIGSPSETDEWNGYTRHTFQFEGRTTYIVDPKSDATGEPWLWRARFWGHRPEVDIALLGRGYHLVYMDVSEMLGNKEAVKHWDHFYKLLTKVYGLNSKAEMEGMSRGGLYVYAWAEKNPHKVAAIYADAPVCDIKSWPLALRNGEPTAAAWKMVVAAFGFSNLDQAKRYRGNPIDNLKPLAREKVPLLHVVGDADTIVPIPENTAVLAEKYKALGGSIQIITKHGVGHVHGLDDPTPIIDFLFSHRPN